MSYTQEGFRGLGWIGAFRIFCRLLAFLRIGILARVLSPLQFGIFGVASLILSFLENITETGIWIFIIQEKKYTRNQIDTAWVMSIARGLMIFTLVYLSATPISMFFNSSESILLIKTIAFVALIRGFISPSRAGLLKRLYYRKESLFSSVILLCDFSVTVILTIILKSPIAMIYGLIAGAILEAILSIVILKPRPRFKFDIKSFRLIAGRGRWLFGARLFNYAFSEGDDVFVGKVFEKNVLGVYQVSYKISILPLTEVTNVINQVTLPIFVKLRSDKKRLINAFRKLIITVTVIVIPIGLLLYIFPHIIVEIFLGDKWKSAIPIIKTLAVFGVLRSITVCFNSLFNSLKLQKYIAYYTFISLLTLAISIYPLTLIFGLMGTVYAVTLGALVALIINVYIFHLIS